MATKNKINLDINTIKDSSSKVNKFILDTTEMLVDETIGRTAEWQNLTDKAIKGGFKLAENQADLAFKALEALKRQWKKGQKNYRERINS